MDRGVATSGSVGAEPLRRRTQYLVFGLEHHDLATGAGGVATGGGGAPDVDVVDAAGEDEAGLFAGHGGLDGFGGLPDGCCGLLCVLAA